MTWLIDFFKSLGSLVVSLATLIWDAIYGGIQIIEMLPQYISYASDTIAMLPSWLSVFCIGIIAIAAVWAIRKAL